MIISIHVVQVKHILQMKAKFPHKKIYDIQIYYMS